ncbi:MAG TPA: hypothetical protein VFV66_29680, partial [Nonomuraea sp.]|nr:hypothetical protein [Nonomuraea sp.]
EALHGSGDLETACRALGAARAADGVGLIAGMNDLAALFAVAGRGEPPFAASRAYAAGWALARTSELTCEDPLTGLATTAYLRTRLAEIYRGAGGRTCLVVAEPAEQPRDLAERVAVALNLATALRRAFTGDETLAALAPLRVGALAPEDDRLPDRVAGLRAAEILYDRRPLVRVRSLPKAYGQALALIRTLSLDA